MDRGVFCEVPFVGGRNGDPGVSRVARSSEPPDFHKTNDNHIVLEIGGGSYPKVALTSVVLVQTDRWYHTEKIVTEENRKSLFVDGILQDSGVAPTGVDGGYLPPIIFGADQHGRHPLRGLMDEIVVYNRALTPAEVKSLATSCPVPAFSN